MLSNFLYDGHPLRCLFFGIIRLEPVTGILQRRILVPSLRGKTYGVIFSITLAVDEGKKGRRGRRPLQFFVIYPNKVQIKKPLQCSGFLCITDNSSD